MLLLLCLLSGGPAPCESDNILRLTGILLPLFLLSGGPTPCKSNGGILADVEDLLCAVLASAKDEDVFPVRALAKEAGAVD